MFESWAGNIWTTARIGLFPTLSHKFPVLSMHLGAEIPWTQGLAFPLTLYGMTPLADAYQPSENLRCNEHKRDGRTTLGAPQSLIPPPNHSSHHMSSWITNWRRHSPTRRANRTRQPCTNRGTLVSLPEPVSFDHHWYQLPSDILGCAGWAWKLAGWRETPRQGTKEWFSHSSLWVNIYPAALGLK